MEEFLVGAASGVTTSLLGKLATKLTDEYKLLKGVWRDIEYLKDELEAMEAFLLMMADVEEPAPQARLHAQDVRELSYAIKDKIDRFMLLISHESSSRSKSMKKITNLKKRHKIAKGVKDIKSKVKEPAERRARYKTDESSMPKSAKVDPRLCVVYKDTSELVGVDIPGDELVTRKGN